MNSTERLILAITAALERAGDPPEEIALMLELAHAMPDADLRAWLDDLEEMEGH